MHGSAGGRLALPLLVVGGGAVAATLALALVVGQVTEQGSKPDGWIQLLPWLCVAGLGIGSFWMSVRGVLLTGSALAAFCFRYLPSLVVGQLPGAPHTPVVFVKSPPEAANDWLRDIAQGNNSTVNAAHVLFAIGIVVAFAAIGWWVWSIRSLLLRPAIKVSFGLDTTVLITLFVVVAMSGWPGQASLRLPWMRAGLTAAQESWATLNTLPWVLLLALWLAFACRRGGALALGAAAGLVGSVVVLPLALQWGAKLVGGPTGWAMLGDGVFWTDGTFFDSWTFFLGASPDLNWVLNGLALALLLVIGWWVFGEYPQQDRATVRASSSARINSTATLAFVLSWLPLTSVAAIVLGHMGYDQIVSQEDPQRGIGLARSAIVIGYLTLGAATVVVIYRMLGN